MNLQAQPIHRKRQDIANQTESRCMRYKWLYIVKQNQVKKAHVKHIRQNRFFPELDYIHIRSPPTVIFNHHIMKQAEAQSFPQDRCRTLIIIAHNKRKVMP